MSLESAAKFISRYNDDAEFRAKFDSAHDEEARNEIIRSEGFSFTKEELKHVYSQPTELSNGDLDAVAGGVTQDPPPPPTFV